MTTEVMPQPVAVGAVVFNDPATRTLHVRLPDKASGYERLQWQQGWQQLRRAEESGWTRDAPVVWASTPTGRQVVHGRSGEGGTLQFHFPNGVAAYSELVGKPRLAAIATIDRGTHHILGVKFLHRPGV